MTDPFLLMTPVLALAVFALARFVGCELVFQLKDVPPEIPFVESTVLGEPRSDFTGWVGMVIVVGPNPITVTDLGRSTFAASAATHEVKLVLPAGTSGTDLGTVTIPASAVIQGYAYAPLQPSVVLQANTEYYVVSHETNGGDRWFDFPTVVTTTGVASVTSGVFNDDANLAGYVLQPGANRTYVPVNFRY